MGIKESYTEQELIYLGIERMVLMRRLLSLLLATVIVFAMSTSAFATGFTTASNMDIYAKQVLEKYVIEIHPEVVNAYISNPITVYNINENASHTVYFALSDTDVLGILSVSLYEGQYISSYAHNVSECIKNAYKNQTSISLIVSGEKTCVKIGNTVYKAFGNNKIVTIPAINARNLNSSIIQPKEVLSLASSRAMNLLFHRYLNVQHVANSGPKCWAACVAMVVNYLNGVNLSTEDVYNTCVEAYKNIDTELPIGTMKWYERAFELYGWTASSTITNPSLTANQIYGSLFNNKPIIFDMQRIVTGTSANDPVHAMVLFGITGYIDTSTFQNSAFYYVYEPNDDTVISLYTDDNVFHNGNNLVVPVASGYVYTIWYRTTLVL